MNLEPAEYWSRLIADAPFPGALYENGRGATAVVLGVARRIRVEGADETFDVVLEVDGAWITITLDAFRSRWTRSVPR